MSFWRFAGFAPSTNTVDSLINSLPLDDSTTILSSSERTILYDTTLDALLATPDLLSEIKSGANTRLRDFLARAEAIERLTGWIVWGLGGGPDQPDNGEEGAAASIEEEEGTTTRETHNEKQVVGKRKKAKLGRVPRRRDMNAVGELEGGVETAEEKSWAGYPRLATEILATDTPSLSDILFMPENASSQPESCPSPASILIPFWETLLDSTELQLETRSIQVGYWTRVNAVLLAGSHGQELLAIILSIPQVLPRLLALLPFCSPINDLLLVLLRLSSPPSPLHSNIIPATLRMLDPTSPVGKESHVAAEELLKGIIEFCSAAPAQILQPPPPVNSPIGVPPPAPIEEEVWRENGLARQIADPRTIRILLDWMLDNTGTESYVGDATPRPRSIELLASTPESTSLYTSSLLESISVLIDLIRKNNSDFVEQQALAWARRREFVESSNELTADIDLEEPSNKVDSDRGPCVLDLSQMLEAVATRIEGFQQLIVEPRSLIGVIATTMGEITPLTLERFRICEFYAELLHCSNMSLLNRPSSVEYLYDSEGYLARGWRAADDLGDALSGYPIDDTDRESRQPSPHFSPRLFPDISSPIEFNMPYSGTSTPSAAGSLDSESGILTRAEARELKELLASSAANPFEDPDADVIELGEAIGSLDIEAGFVSRDQSMQDLSITLRRNESLRKSRMNRTPSITALTPGQLLKREFIHYGIVNTMLDSFFEFPWNNFLHNVVFDIIQQIFHGRLDRPLDRELALSVFFDAKLIDRILAGHAANEIEISKVRGVRLGYLGHMTQIAEEIIKLFTHYPQDIYDVVSPSIPQPAWDNYVSITLRETLERGLAPLGGSIMTAPQDAPSTASGLSDEDDEFPMNSARMLRAMGEGGNGTAGEEEGSPGGHGKAIGGNGSPDQFSQYLAAAISSDRPDKFGSSDEEDDEDDAGWLGGSKFESADVDYNESDSAKEQKPKRFDFDHGFDSAAEPRAWSSSQRQSSSDSDDDADWGPFSADSPALTLKSLPVFDDFKPTIDSAFAVNDPFPPFGTMDSSFSDDFGTDNFVSASSGEEDFGEFETSLTTASTSDDFDDFSSPSLVEFPTTSFDSTSFFPISIPSDDPSSLTRDSIPLPTSPRDVADLATDIEHPLGPSMHEGSHLTSNGTVEADVMVDGKLQTIRVPADDIALAHHRQASHEL